MNRTPFSGVLAFVNAVSDKVPAGACGHRVRISREVAEDALPGLVGMAVNFNGDWTGHNTRQKIGVITAAEIVTNEVRVRGHIFSHDFPEVITAAYQHELGMSYELADAYVRDMREAIWELSRITFVGAAVLRRDKAAYQKTQFNLEAV